MKKRLLLLTLLVLLAVWLWWGNSALMVTEYAVESHRVPAGFEGFRIAQISDLHNGEFGRDNEKLLVLLEKTEPDIILLTGDLVDSRRTDISAALAFGEQAVKIAPCYYVTGNHEARIPELPELLEGLENSGVTVLRNEKLPLERGGDRVMLLGVDDPSFQTDYLTGNSGSVMTEALTELVTGETDYTILLSHRPELFALYSSFGADLVFSGHAHGGQIRLPFVGGLIAPNQGLFPKYDAGVFTEGDTAMVVSRGIGASIIPLRIGNRPEIVVAELHR